MNAIRFLSIGTLMIMFLTTTKAQHSIGLMAGPNFSKTFYTGVGEGTEGLTSFKGGITAGLCYDQVLCESFTLAFNGRYSRAYSSIYDEITEANFKFKMQIVDIPIQIKYRFGKSKVNFVIGAGPAIAKLEDFDFRWNVTGMSGFVTDYKKFNFGVDVNYNFRPISDIFFTDSNGSPIGRSGQKLMYFNVFAKYSIPL